MQIVLRLDLKFFSSQISLPQLSNWEMQEVDPLCKI